MITNAAIEPEILELITMLRAMGAVIFTSSGREIRIEGVKELKGTHTNVSSAKSDRMAMGVFTEKKTSIAVLLLLALFLFT